MYSVLFLPLSVQASTHLLVGGGEQKSFSLHGRDTLQQYGLRYYKNIILWRLPSGNRTLVSTSSKTTLCVLFFFFWTSSCPGRMFAWTLGCLLKPLATYHGVQPATGSQPSVTWYPNRHLQETTGLAPEYAKAHLVLAPHGLVLQGCSRQEESRGKRRRRKSIYIVISPGNIFLFPTGINLILSELMI